MTFEMQREYRLKFYLNAQHFFPDPMTGEAGEVHPHTWEFTLRIAVGQHDFTPFHVFERGIAGHLEPYQNKVMNSCPPFDVVLPTIESMTEMFAKEFDAILREQGGELQSVEGSEGPTRSFIVTIQRPADEPGARERKAEALSDIIDNVLDDATGKPKKKRKKKSKAKKK